MRKSKEEQPGGHFVEWFLRILIGGAAGLAICLFVLGIGAWAVSTGKLSADILSRICVAGCFIGSFFGSMIALRGGRGKTLFTGLGVGVVLFLFLLMAGVIFYRSVSPMENGLVLICGALAGGALAGLISARPHRKKKIGIYKT